MEKEDAYRALGELVATAMIDLGLTTIEEIEFRKRLSPDEATANHVTNGFPPIIAENIGDPRNPDSFFARWVRNRLATGVIDQRHIPADWARHWRSAEPKKDDASEIFDAA